jgi:hypothetical protein
MQVHREDLMDAFDKDWFDAKEGEASVLDPTESQEAD